MIDAIKEAEEVISGGIKELWSDCLTGWQHAQIGIIEKGVEVLLSHAKALQAKLDAAEIDFSNSGAAITSDLLRKIAENGRESGVFGGEEVEKCAQAILKLRAKVEELEKRCEALEQLKLKSHEQAMESDVAWQDAVAERDALKKRLERANRFHCVLSDQGSLLPRVGISHFKTDLLKTFPAENICEVLILPAEEKAGEV